MVFVVIPLIGIVDLEIEQIWMIGMSTGIILDKDLKVSYEVWKKMIDLKYAGRYRNIDDVLRDHFGMIPVHPPVKHYSDREADVIGVVQDERNQANIES